MFAKLFKSRVSISTVLLINTVGITVFSLFLIGYLWISQARDQFIEETDLLRFEYFTSQKQILKREVERAIRYIRFHKDLIHARLQESLKNRVYEAHGIAFNIWKANQGRKSDTEIMKMISDALKGIRFNNGRGYYFVMQVDGIAVLFGDQTDGAGKNYWNAKDAKGNYFVREMSRIVTEEKEGFITYTTSKPDAEDVPLPKMTFVKHFEPYNWYIGTGEFLEDFEATVKKEVLKLIQRVEYSREGYVFAGSWDGTSLSGPALGKNMINITDINGLKIVQKLINVAKEGGGYVTYVMPSLDGKRQAPKISYVEGLYKWQWYIGAGIYTDEIYAVIAERRLILEKQIREKIFNIVLILVSCLIIILFIVRIVSRRIRRNIQSLTDFFETSSTTFVPIDVEQLHFPEFSQLAVSANRMIDERIKAGGALRESEEQMRVILNSVKIGIVIIDPEGFKIVSINSHAEKMINLPANKIIGQKSALFLGPHPEYDNPAEFFPNGDLHADKVLLNSGGAKIPIIKSFAKIIFNGKQHFLESFIDITDLKAREKEIQDLRNYLKSIIDSMPSAIIGVDSHGFVTQYNVEAETIMSGSSTNASNMHWKEILSKLSVDLSAIDSAINNKKPYRAENVKVLANDELQYLDITVYPLISDLEGGAVIRIDKVTERVKLSELLIQTEKMMSVGGLAAGMAHEINNPLAAIIQSVQVLEKRLKADSLAIQNIAAETGVSGEQIHSRLEKQKIYAMIKAIKESGFRAAKIVSNMLSFSKKSEYDANVYNIADLMDKTIDLATNDYNLITDFDFKKISIHREYTEPIPEFLCEASQIQQVFLNILKNGAHAMMETADIRKPQFILRIKPDKESVIIEIEDNGPGMNDDVKRRVFEPFFTTKSGNVGTGLGLSVSYFIITENHKGLISVDSTPGKGTIFTIKLPM